MTHKCHKCGEEIDCVDHGDKRVCVCVVCFDDIVRECACEENGKKD